jgi:hypothetical protein
MPCKPSKARKLLKEGKAKVIRTMPFTIKLIYGSSGYTQPIIAGMDTGSKVIGCSAIANGTLQGKEKFNRVFITAENVGKRGKTMDQT